MTALGFGTDYMEKYVPFTINLSDIAFKDLVDQALSEETQLNGDLCKNDFSFFHAHYISITFFQMHWD